MNIEDFAKLVVTMTEAFGMAAENDMRRVREESPAYTEDDFFRLADSIQTLIGPSMSEKDWFKAVQESRHCWFVVDEDGLEGDENRTAHFKESEAVGYADHQPEEYILVRADLIDLK